MKRGKSNFNSRFNIINNTNIFPVSKQSQITVFIIIAIVLLSAIVIISFAMKKGGNSTDNFSNDPIIQSRFLQMRTSIYDCMKFTSENALDLIGYQGGYFNKTSDFLDFGFIFVPYYYDSGKILVPENSEVENQLSEYINTNLKPCILGINNSDFNLSFGDIDTKTNIKENEVLFSVDMPVTIQREYHSVKLELSNEPISVPSKLHNILDVSKFIVENHKKEPESFCVSCIDSFAKERNVYVEISQTNMDNSTNLIILSENTTRPDFYIFEFLTKSSSNSS